MLLAEGILAIASLVLGWKCSAAADRREALGWKLPASACFLVMGVMSFRVCGDRPLGAVLLAGLALGFAGDALLALSDIHAGKRTILFALGTLAFALGHGCYIVALALRGGFRPLALAYSLPAFLAEAGIARHYRVDAGKLQPLGYGYMAAVSLMGGFAFALAVTAPSAATALFALGGTLFVVSDTVLCVHRFGKRPHRHINGSVLLTYYAAQALLALGMLWI